MHNVAIYFKIHRFPLVAILLAIITLVIAKPRPRNEEECGECVPGNPDESNEVPSTEEPADECKSGEVDVTQTIPEDIVTSAPPC